MTASLPSTRKRPAPPTCDNVIAAAASEAPATNAEAALLISPDTGLVLYEKNADERRYPASTTKIMTALLVLEHVDDLSADRHRAGGRLCRRSTADSSTAGIKEGETVTIEGPALRPDAALGQRMRLHARAATSAASYQSVRRADEPARGRARLHGHALLPTPAACTTDDHYTTARDLYKIAKQAMQDETFRRHRFDTVQRTACPPTSQHPDAEGRVITDHQQADPQLVCGIRLQLLPGHQDRQHLAGGQLLCRLCGVRRRQAVFGRHGLRRPARSSIPTSPPASRTPRPCSSGASSAFTSRTHRHAGRRESATRKVRPVHRHRPAGADRAERSGVRCCPPDLEVEQLEQRTPPPPRRSTPPSTRATCSAASPTPITASTTARSELVALTDVEMSRVLYISDRLSHFFQTARCSR